MINCWQKFWVAMFILSMALLWTGCTSGWVPEAVNIINLVIPAISGIVSLLMAFGVKVPPEVVSGVSQYAQNAITTLNDTVKPLIDEYNSTPADQKQSVLQKIDVAVKEAIAHFQAAADQLPVTIDPILREKILAVMGLVESELQALLALIPVLQAKGTLTMEDLHEAEHPLLSAKQFKKMFNDTLHRKTGDAAIDSVVAHFPSLQ